MSTLGETDICIVENGATTSRTLDARAFGIQPPSLAELRGGDAAQNAAQLEALLHVKAPAAITDMVAWNAAGALTVAGVCADMGAGLALAREAIRSGEAAARLDAMRAATKR